MKTKLPFLLLCLLLAVPAEAVTFAWSPNSDPNIVTYRLYVGTNSGAYQTNYPVTSIFTNLTVPNTSLFTGRTNYAAVTAINSDGIESGFSNEIFFSMPKAPTGFRLALEYAPALNGPWHEVTSTFYDLENPAETQFYRGRIEVQ